MDFDACVLSTGSGYPGVVRAIAAEMSVERRVEEVRKMADSLARAANVVIVGGGAVGVELAAELAASPRRDPSQCISVVCNTLRLLPSSPEAAGVAALHWLQSRGVEVVCGETVKGVAEDGEGTSGGGGASRGAASDLRRSALRNRSRTEGLRIADTSRAPSPLPSGPLPPRSALLTSSGRRISADMLVMATGSRPHAIPLPSWPSAHGRVPANEHLLAETVGGAPVFVAGDVAGDPSSSPMLAHAAEMQGTLVAHAIQGLAHRNGHLPRYPQDVVHSDHPLTIMVVSLGPYEGILQFNELVLADPVGRRIAALAKWFIERTKIMHLRGHWFGAFIWTVGDAVAVFIAKHFFPPKAAA